MAGMGEGRHSCTEERANGTCMIPFIYNVDLCGEKWDKPRKDFFLRDDSSFLEHK